MESPLKILPSTLDHLRLGRMFSYKFLSVTEKVKGNLVNFNYFSSYFDTFWYLNDSQLWQLKEQLTQMVLSTVKQLDNHADFVPDSPVPTQWQQNAQSVDGCKYYLSRYSYGVRCVKRNFAHPDLLRRWSKPLQFQMANTVVNMLYIYQGCCCAAATLRTAKYKVCGLFDGMESKLTDRGSTTNIAMAMIVNVKPSVIWTTTKCPVKHTVKMTRTGVGPKLLPQWL